MPNSPQYYLVEASALPDVFRRVAEAKRLLSTGEVSTVNEAASRTNISRSAFYKYRDAIMPFQDFTADRVITFQLMLRDEPGVLAGILTTFTSFETNILTITSIIPTNGCALVTISAETSGINAPLEQMMSRLRETPNVIKAEIVAG